MRAMVGLPFDNWRDCSQKVIEMYGSIGDFSMGVFRVPVPETGKLLLVIATSGEGWDHVSVSLPNRCPTWEEMNIVKKTFFRVDEWAYQLHPPDSENRCLHNFCLHMWRSHDQKIPLPDPMMVAPPNRN